MKSPVDFVTRCRLKEKRQCLNQIGPSFFNRWPLAGNIQFRRERHKSIVLAFDNSGDLPDFTHISSLRQSRIRLRMRLQIKIGSPQSTWTARVRLCGFFGDLLPASIFPSRHSRGSNAILLRIHRRGGVASP